MSKILLLLKTITEIANTISEALSFYRKAKEEGWYEDAKIIASRVRGAKTDEERKELVRKLADWSVGF
jgi:hypothetical protein